MGSLPTLVDAVYYFFSEVNRMTVKYAILYILMLPVGLALTVITLLRMRAGTITLPHWAKILLIIGMILSQLILVASMMPPIVYQAVKDTFINTDTHAVTPMAPSSEMVPGSTD